MHNGVNSIRRGWNSPLPSHPQKAKNIKLIKPPKACSTFETSAWPSGKINPQLTPTHPNSPQLTPTHPNSPQLTPTHPNSPQLTPTHPNSPQLTPTDPNSPQLTPTRRLVVQPALEARSHGSASPALALWRWGCDKLSLAHETWLLERPPCKLFGGLVLKSPGCP